MARQPFPPTWRSPARRRCTALPIPCSAPSASAYAKSVTRIRAPEAPIGCPRAMAPPLTFTLSRLKPSSRPRRGTGRQRLRWLRSDRDRPLSNQPFPKPCGWRGWGQGPSRRAPPALAQPTMRARGERPRSAASPASMSTRAAAPSFTPEALPAVTTPSFLKAGRNLPSTSMVVPGRGTHHERSRRIFLLLHVYGHDFFIEHARFQRGCGPLLGKARHGRPVLHGKDGSGPPVLGGDAHVIVVESVPEAVPNHLVHKLDIAHAAPQRAEGRT